MVIDKGWRTIRLFYDLRINPVGRSFHFVYPIWWSSMPSLLKGWIDRVLRQALHTQQNNRGSFILNYLRGKQFKNY